MDYKRGVYDHRGAIRHSSAPIPGMGKEEVKGEVKMGENVEVKALCNPPVVAHSSFFASEASLRAERVTVLRSSLLTLGIAQTSLALRSLNRSLRH